MIYLNGHSLPYKSTCFPELVDTTHPNVQKEFFSNILDLAKTYKLNLIGVLSTTGHAGRYTDLNPHLSIKARRRGINIEKLLLPFPRHIRKTKSKAFQGCAQVGKGILCHNKPLAQQFVNTLIKECLEIYNHFDGIALHPPESIYPCECPDCCSAFASMNHSNLLTTSIEKAQFFYIESYLEFQKRILEKQVELLIPNVQLYTITIPWLFEKNFEKLAIKIPKKNIIIDWDYNLSTPRVNELQQRIINYQRFGHQVWFTAALDSRFYSNKKLGRFSTKLSRQIKSAREAGATKIIRFSGPYLERSINL